MLDQPVPNPFAKNPNVHTHKVFAAVGLILIGVIIAVAGIWYYVEGKSRTTDTAIDENTTTKVSTSSAKTATKSSSKDETADWKTFKTEEFEIKHPMDWTTNKVDQTLTYKNFVLGFIFGVGYDFSTQNYEKWETIEGVFKGENHKLNDITFKDGTWSLFPQAGGSASFIVKGEKVPTADEKTLILKVIATFKVL